jgi:hypothetical protein
LYDQQRACIIEQRKYGGAVYRIVVVAKEWANRGRIRPDKGAMGMESIGYKGRR